MPRWITRRFGPCLHVDRETEIRDLVARVAGRKKNSVRTQVRNLRKFVESSMGDVRSLLAGKHANAAATRMALAKHVQEVVLLPEDEGQAIKYRGKWKLLGNSSGAEGQS